MLHVLDCLQTQHCNCKQEQQRQEVLSLDNYVTYNEALIEERDQGIAEIGQQINEVHEIFQVRGCYRAACRCCMCRSRSGLHAVVGCEGRGPEYSGCNIAC